MKVKRVIAAALVMILSAPMLPQTVEYAAAAVPSYFYLNTGDGGKNFENGYSDDKIEVSIDGGSAVLTIKDDVTLYSTGYDGSYGTPIVAVGGKDYTVRLENGAELSLRTQAPGDYIYGLYITGDVSIEGNGTVDIVSGGGTEESAGVRCYGDDASLHISGARVKSSDSGGYGVWDDKDCITLENGAVLEANGGAGAFKNKLPSKRLIVSAGGSAADAEDMPENTDGCKYVRLEAYLDYDADAHALFTNDKTAVTSGMTAYMPSGDPEISNRDYRDGWFLKPDSYPSSYIRCDIDDSIMNSLDGSCSVVVAVDYYDGDIKGGFGLYYDSRTGPKTEFVQLDGTSQWKTKVFRLYDAYFDGGAMTDDLRIVTDSEDMGRSGANVLISGIYVSADENDAPFEITAFSNELGNIFFEGYKIEFDVEYKNTGQMSYSGLKADYTVKDSDGNVCMQLNHDITASPSFTDKLDLGSDLPFGVYTLNVYLHGEGVEQRKVIDFAYSRSVDEEDGVNKNIGINIHFDDEIYNEQEMRKQARLLWYAGFGFARSSVRWSDVEKKKDEYSVPNNIKYAEDFLDKEETGIETLAILYNQNDLYDSPPYYLDTDGKLDAFKNYCEFVAKNINTDYFCMLNEFNHDSSGYLDNMEEYKRISEAGIEAIKSVKPDAWVNGGSLAGASRYWNQVENNEITKDLLDMFDSFSWHIYAHDSGPENEYFQRAKSLNEFVDETSANDTAMWITESGWPTKLSNDPEDEDTNLKIANANEYATEQEQARWYARAMALFSDKTMADRFFFYNLIDAENDYFDIQANFGIIHAKDHRTPFAAKPAYVAACAFNDLVDCTGLEEIKMTDDGVYAYEFKNGTLCLWTEDGKSGSYTFTKHQDSKYIAVYDMYGNAEYYEGERSKTLSIGPEPIYVKSTSEKTEITDIQDYDYDPDRFGYIPYTPERPQPEPIPDWITDEDGVFWSDDFSNAAVYDWMNAETNVNENLLAMRDRSYNEYGGYDNVFGVSVTPEKGHGRVLVQPTGINSGFYLYLKDIGGTAEENIDMHTLVISQDVYIPAGSYTGGKAYTETWSAERVSADTTSSGVAHLFEISADSGSAKAVFQTKPAAIDAIAIAEDGKNTVSLDFDTWHRIETVVSYAAGTVEYYVDGQRAAIYRGTPDDIERYFPMTYFGLRSDTDNAGDVPLTVEWDNFKLRVIDDDFVPSKSEYIEDEEYEEEHKLIDMDFENMTGFDTNYIRLVQQTSPNDYTFQGNPDDTGTYAKIEYGNGGKMLEYEHFLGDYPRNGLKFPFHDLETGKSVTADSGILIVEFDAGVRGATGRSRVLIGLNDPNKTDSEWTPATLLSGIMPYHESKLSVTIPDQRNEMSADSSMDTTMVFTEQGEMHHYKYIVDIDRGTYKMYYDGILIAECDSLAGDAKNNSFDALMITGVNAGDSTDGETYIMIDNISVRSAERNDGYSSETEYLGTFNDDENAEHKTGIASGYITTINDISRQDRVIENIMWRFKADNGAIKELKPTDGADIMLNGGMVSITVIVDGLDHEAKPIATVIN